MIALLLKLWRNLKKMTTKSKITKEELLKELKEVEEQQEIMQYRIESLRSMVAKYVLER